MNRQEKGEKMGLIEILKKWGAVGALAIAIIYYLQEKVTGQARCNRIHEKLTESNDDTFKNIRGEVDAKFNSLKDTINNFKLEMVRETTETKERLDGLGTRMTNHYQSNTKQYIEILEEIRGRRK